MKTIIITLLIILSSGFSLLQAQGEKPSFREPRYSQSFTDFVASYMMGNFYRQRLTICVRNNFAVAFKFDQNKKITDIRFSEDAVDTLKAMVRQTLLISEPHWTIPDGYIGKNFIFFIHIDWDASCYIYDKVNKMSYIYDMLHFDDGSYHDWEDCFLIGYAVSVSSFFDIRRAEFNRRKEEEDKLKKK